MMALRVYAMYQRKAIIIIIVCAFGLYSIATLTVSHITCCLLCEMK